MPTLTPGAYLKHRRTAAGFSVADVAAKLSTVPRTAERLRAEQLALIEADAQPATFSTIVALRAIYRFDVTILARLDAIAQGHRIVAPRLCRICACSEHDACPGGCAWAEADLCTDCVAPAAIGAAA